MFGSDWAAWGGMQPARMPEPKIPGVVPGYVPPTPTDKHVEETMTFEEPTFSLGISHCPWLADRAENMKRMRAVLHNGEIRLESHHEETGRAANNVWSRRLWGWAAAQRSTHVVLLQDDIRIHERFLAIVRAMVKAVPNRVIGLITNHPLSKRALAEGHAWLRMCETLGTGYVVPTVLLPVFLEWYDSLNPAWVAGNCEDFIFSQWVCCSGRKTWCPIPTAIQTQDVIPTSHASNPVYTFRKSYIAWDDPRVAGRDLTSVDYWTPKTLPPDFGHAVSQDTRYPPSPFTNEQVLAAHYGSDVKPAPGLKLRVQPPRTAGLDEGIKRVLAGSYDVPLEFRNPPRVGDIGGNVGSFSVFIGHRYPGAKIIAYEPAPDSAELCRQNVAGIAEVVEAAVVGEGHPDHLTLYEGVQNTGQRSIYKMNEQRDGGVQVKTIRGRELPPFDILKIDCEGCEVEVLRDYLHLSGVRALMLEWHRHEDYTLLLKWLPKLGFKLLRDDAKGQWLADRNLIYVRERIDPIIVCPGSSLEMLYEQAGYRLGEFPDIANARIIDIGAHVGSFVLKARERWAGSTVLAFEPHPETFALLVANVGGDFPGDEVRNAAVVGAKTDGKLRLYEGVNGRHECSLRDDIKWGPDQTNPLPHVSQNYEKWVDVDQFDAAELPPCDVLKVDCEGGEIAILEKYKHLSGVKVLVTEAHAVGGDLKGQAARIRAIAEAAGLKFVGPDPVVARFVRP